MQCPNCSHQVGLSRFRPYCSRACNVLARARKRRQVEQWFDRKLRKLLLLAPRPHVASQPMQKKLL